jgi:F0F1-type ATP synthase membrane subunit c/vacuolar-type H+-ATPase subunit K
MSSKLDSEEIMDSTCGKNRFRLLGAVLAYAIVGFGSGLAVGYLPSPWKYVVAILPVLPALWFATLFARHVGEMDELQRRIQLESLAFAFSAAVILTLGYGFLQHAGLPTPNWVWVWPLMGVCWLIGKFVAQRRYR